jgi:hypothetical protein
MITIAVAFPGQTTRAATHIVLHLSNVAQSLLLSSLPLPLSLPLLPAIEEGGPLLSSSMLMHHCLQGQRSVPASPLRQAASSYANAVWGGGHGKQSWCPKRQKGRAAPAANIRSSTVSWDYQYVFYLEKVNFHLGKVNFDLISPSI